MRLWVLALLMLTCCCALAQEAAQPDAAVQDLERQVRQACEAARDTAAWQRNLPIAMLAVRKLRLLGDMNQMWFGGGGLKEAIINQGKSALQRAEQGVEPQAVPGKLNELAYLTGNDLTAQPYYLYLPKDYTPEKKWPLVIFLHGYVPTTSILDPWIPPDSVCEIAGKHGCLLLVPYGRRNTDFQGVGEVDVLASTAEVSEHYPVDPDRVYMSGVSMGGMGAWNIALRHPGMYAAVTPMCGQTDMFRWWRWEREDVVKWKQWLVEWDNALDQVQNVRNQNIFVQHGEMDSLIPVEQTKLMLAAAEKQGTPIKSYFYPEENHFIYFLDESYDRAWEWTKQFRLDRSPRRVDFRCYSLEYNRAYWLTIESFDKWGTPAELTAEVEKGGKQLTIKSTNISHLTIDLQQAKLDPAAEVSWNGQKPEGAPRDGLLSLHLPGARVRLAGQLAKTRGLCGPCEEVFDTRFLVVQGTSGTDDQKQTVARQVAQWAKDWDAFADGLPPVKTDTEVTDQDLKDCNLVLFGAPDTNSVLAKIADKLPIKIADHRYEVAGKTYQGADLGLVMCYPNPLNPQHYVLIYSGELYGEQLSVNHKHDLLPDFIVFTTKSFGRDEANEPRCAGFFGMQWEIAKDLVWE